MMSDGILVAIFGMIGGYIMGLIMRWFDEHID